MDEIIKKQIENIIGQMKCPKDFNCANSGFEELCKATDIGLDEYLVCLEENPSSCIFSQPYGKSYYCMCPLRVFIAKNIKK